MSLVISLLVPSGLLALLERWPRARRAPQRLFRAHFWDDLGFLLVGWIALSPLSLWLVAGALSRLHGTGAWEGPRWLWVVLAIVLLDLGNYLAHYLLHRVDVLW